MEIGFAFENSGMKLVCLAFYSLGQRNVVLFQRASVACILHLGTPLKRLTAHTHGLGGIASMITISLRDNTILVMEICKIYVIHEKGIVSVLISSTALYKKRFIWYNEIAKYLFDNE